VIEEKIATLDWVACASPDYLSRAGYPADPAALGDHACLVHVDVAPNDAVWRFTGPEGQVQVKVRGAFFSNGAFALRKAAVAGLGITMIPRYAVVDDLANGALEIVLPHYHVASRPLLAVYPKALVTPPKVQVFVDYLKDWMIARNFNVPQEG
jgi:DNA-binding transcriptional LysR family regulator